MDFLEEVRGPRPFSTKGRWLRMEAKQGRPISSVLPNCVIPELLVQLTTQFQLAEHKERIYWLG